MKKICVAGLIFILLGFSGCHRSISEGPSIHVQPQNEQITLRFINSWGGYDSNAEALATIFDNFEEKYPHIRIQNESTCSGAFLDKLKTDFATENDPDVFGLWPGSDMEALIQADKVANLTAMLEVDQAWKRSFINAWDYCTVDEKIYGLPVEIIYEALFINTEIFDQYDLKAPKTYEDLCILVRFFSRKAVIPFAYNYTSEGTYLYQNIVAQLGGSDALYDSKACYIDGMQKMKQLYDLRAFPKDAYRLSDLQRNNLFLNGEAAMIVQGSWFTRDLYQAHMASKVDIVPFPIFDKDKEGYSLIYGLGCGTFFMSKKAYEDEEKREAALLLLKELTSKEASKILTSGSGFISNIDISEVKGAYPSLYTKGIQLITNAHDLVPPPDSIIDRNAWEEIIVPGFNDIYEYGIGEADTIWSQVDVGS